MPALTAHTLACSCRRRLRYSDAKARGALLSAFVVVVLVFVVVVVAVVAGALPCSDNAAVGGRGNNTKSSGDAAAPEMTWRCGKVKAVQGPRGSRAYTSQARWKGDDCKDVYDSCFANDVVVLVDVVERS